MFACEAFLEKGIIFIVSQSMMSNPDLIRQMILGNPQMQQLIEVLYACKKLVCYFGGDCVMLFKSSLGLLM